MSFSNISVNPFEICDYNDECTNNITSYKFLKNRNYTINIHFINIYNNNYYYSSFYFFPVLEDTIENITNGYYFFSIPKIFYINLENKDYLTYLYKEGEILYFS